MLHVNILFVACCWEKRGFITNTTILLGNHSLLYNISTLSICCIVMMMTTETKFIKISKSFAKCFSGGETLTNGKEIDWKELLGWVTNNMYIQLSNARGKSEYSMICMISDICHCCFQGGSQRNYFFEIDDMKNIKTDPRNKLVRKSNFDWVPIDHL